MLIYLFGYLRDDFFGRVVVTPDSQTVDGLAQQLAAWGWGGEHGRAFTVTNERGVPLDPAMSLAAAGLRAGDIFAVDRVP